MDNGVAQFHGERYFVTDEGTEGNFGKGTGREGRHVGTGQAVGGGTETGGVFFVRGCGWQTVEFVNGEHVIGIEPSTFGVAAMQELRVLGNGTGHATGRRRFDFGPACGCLFGQVYFSFVGLLLLQ